MAQCFDDSIALPGPVCSYVASSPRAFSSSSLQCNQFVGFQARFWLDKPRAPYTRMPMSHAPLFMAQGNKKENNKNMTVKERSMRRINESQVN